MRRDQTLYTCDGCGTSKAYAPRETPQGWHTVATTAIGEPDRDDPKNVDLCASCFAGVEWITRFQGRSAPPKVIAEPKPLRRLNITAQLCAAADQHPYMERCGLCGYTKFAAGGLHVPTDATAHVFGDLHSPPHVHNHRPNEGRGLDCPESLDPETGHLRGACLTTEITEP